MTRIGGVLVQLVEIPGLIEGAGENRGRGRALLGVLRSADAIAFCHAATAPFAELESMRAEGGGGGHPPAVASVATKAHEASPGAVERLRERVPDLAFAAVSVDGDVVEILS